MPSTRRRVDVGDAPPSAAEDLLMPRQAWTDKGERQYEHIKESYEDRGVGGRSRGAGRTDRQQGTPRARLDEGAACTPAVTRGSSRAERRRSEQSGRGPPPPGWWPTRRWPARPQTAGVASRAFDYASACAGVAEIGRRSGLKLRGGATLVRVQIPAPAPHRPDRPTPTPSGVCGTGRPTGAPQPAAERRCGRARMPWRSIGRGVRPRSIASPRSRRGCPRSLP